MRPSPFSLFMDMSRLAVEANIVIGLRMMKLAAGGHAASAEAHRMVLEKIETANRVAFDNALALMTGKSAPAVGKSTVATYRKAVRANHRRLTRSK